MEKKKNKSGNIGSFLRKYTTDVSSGGVKYSTVKTGEKKKKKPGMDGNLMNMISSFTVLRFTGMLGIRNVTFTKEELLKMNAKLNRIRKPSKPVR